jgi:hypothetical protein
VYEEEKTKYDTFYKNHVEKIPKIETLTSNEKDYAWSWSSFVIGR